MNVDEVMEKLYRLPPEQFIEGRDAYAVDARKAKDAQAAHRIAALRKPSLAAWPSNLLVHEDRPAADKLLELGAALREAHHSAADWSTAHLPGALHPAFARPGVPCHPGEPWLTEAACRPRLSASSRSQGPIVSSWGTSQIRLPAQPHLGSCRDPAGQFVRPAQGLPKQPLRLGADAPDVAVFRPGQCVARPSAVVLVLVHGGNRGP